MPVIIDEFEAQITPETEPMRDADAGTTGSGVDGHVTAPQPALQGWLALRELAAEREARLAVD